MAWPSLRRTELTLLLHEAWDELDLQSKPLDIGKFLNFLSRN
jgi:hypothetical protein